MVSTSLLSCKDHWNTHFIAVVVIVITTSLLKNPTTFASQNKFMVLKQGCFSEFPHPHPGPNKLQNSKICLLHFLRCNLHSVKWTNFSYSSMNFYVCMPSSKQIQIKIQKIPSTLVGFPQATSQSLPSGNYYSVWMGFFSFFSPFNNLSLRFLYVFAKNRSLLYFHCCVVFHCMNMP